MIGAEQREKAAAATLISVQAELVSARAELLSLQQRVASAESFAQQSREEALRRQTLLCEHVQLIWQLRMCIASEGSPSHAREVLVS